MLAAAFMAATTSRRRPRKVTVLSRVLPFRAQRQKTWKSATDGARRSNRRPVTPEPGMSLNLYLGFRFDALGSGWERAQVQTMRRRLFQIAGKIVRHGRQALLKISAAMLADVCGDPRPLRAAHAGRRRCARNIVIVRRVHFRYPTRRTEAVDGGAARKTPRQCQSRRPKPLS